VRPYIRGGVSPDSELRLPVSAGEPCRPRAERALGRRTAVEQQFSWEDFVADIAIEDAVTRNCDALIAGNIAQIFADMTPQAMAKLSQSAGAAMGGPMPKLTGYDIVGREQEGEEHIYDVRFQGEANFGVKGRWKEIDNVWKLIDFEAYQMDA
jgi:hypothetical protein